MSVVPWLIPCRCQLFTFPLIIPIGPCNILITIELFSWDKRGSCLRSGFKLEAPRACKYKCSVWAIRTSSTLEILLINPLLVSRTMTWCHQRVKTTEELPIPIALMALEPMVPPAVHAPPPDTHTVCNHHFPAHYRDGGTEHDSDAQESFDIHCNSDGASSDASQSWVASTQGTTSATTTAVNMATTDPLATSQSSQDHSTRKGKNIAYDIHHFFNRGKECSICLPCECVYCFYSNSWLCITNIGTVDYL